MLNGTLVLFGNGVVVAVMKGLDTFSILRFTLPVNALDSYRSYCVSLMLHLLAPSQCAAIPRTVRPFPDGGVFYVKGGVAVGAEARVEHLPAPVVIHPVIKRGGRAQGFADGLSARVIKQARRIIDRRAAAPLRRTPSSDGGLRFASRRFAYFPMSQLHKQKPQLKEKAAAVRVT